MTGEAPGRAHPVCAHRLRDVLEEAFAEIVDVRVEYRHQQLAHLGGHDDLAGAGELREPRCEVDAAAVHVAFVGDHLANVRTHAQQHLSSRRDPRVDGLARAMDCEGGFHCCRDLWKLDHEAVAEALDEAPAVRGQHFAGDSLDQSAPAPYHVILVLLHETHGLDQVRDEHRPQHPLRRVR